MRVTTRSRDIALQGRSNPMLGDFGERLEAGQYGQPVGIDRLGIGQCYRERPPDCLSERSSTATFKEQA